MRSLEISSPPPSPEAVAPKGDEVFSPANLDELRAKQKRLIKEALEHVDHYDEEAVKSAKQAVYDTFDIRVKNYLVKEGVVSGDDDPRMEKAVEYLRGFSIDNMPEDKWRYDAVDENGVRIPSGRDDVREDYKQLVSDKAETRPPVISETEPVKDPVVKKEETDEPKPETKTDTPETKDDKKEDEPKPPEVKKDEDEPKSEADKAKEEKEKEKEKERKERAERRAKRAERINELQKEAKGLGRAKHTAFAARMAVPAFRRKKREEMDEQYDAAEEAYLDTLEEIHQLRLEQKFDVEGTDPTLKDKKLAGNELRLLEGDFSEMLEREHKAHRKAMLEEGGFKATLLEKYASLGKKGKIMLALGAGALIAGTGGLVLTIAGGIAGATVATAAAGVAARSMRTVKTYATLLSRMYAPKDKDRFKVKERDGAYTESEIVQKVLGKLRQESREDIKDADKAKKMAVLGALGAAALGSAGGVLISHLVEGSSLVSVTDRAPGWLGGKAGDALAGPESTITPGTNAEQWAVQPSAEVTKVYGYSPDAHIMSAGEGGYKTFKEMGIDQAHWSELWQKVGPELQNINTGSGPLTYQMGPGEWGFRMTPDGKMPPEALDHIARAHEELYGSAPGGVTVTETPVAVNMPSPAANLESTPLVSDLNAEQLQNLENIVKMDAITAAEVSKYPDLLNELAHIAPNVSAEEFAKIIGLPHDIWVNHLQPYIEQRLGVGDPNYTSVFAPSGENIIFTGSGSLSPYTIADLLRQIPERFRDSFQVVR